jgi:hypothetical protein
MTLDHSVKDISFDRKADSPSASFRIAPEIQRFPFLWVGLAGFVYDRPEEGGGANEDRPGSRFEYYAVILEERSVFVEGRPVHNSAAFMLHLVEGSQPPLQAPFRHHLWQTAQ